MKKALSFLATIVLLGVFAPQAWGVNEGTVVTPSGHTLSYRLFVDDSSISIYRASTNPRPTGHLIIPDSVTREGVTYPVRTVSGFINCPNLTSVTLPNTVQVIGFRAFNGCSRLNSINIPNSVTTINGEAFYECHGLDSINIPSSVTNIGSGAFAHCTGLTSVSFNAINCADANVGESNYWFYNCYNLENFYIGDSVTRIPKYLCYDKHILSITIPNSVTYISSYAFYGSYLYYVTISSSVTHISNRAFYDCMYLHSIHCLAATAPTLGTHVFGGTTPSTTPIYIPCGSTSSYQGEWYRFSNFIEDGFDYAFNVVSESTTKGTVQVLTQPSCSSPAVVSATANDGYIFDHWSSGATDNPYTINVTSDTTLTAFFRTNAPQQYTITVNSDNATMGSVSGGGTYNSGATATLTATPNSGYRFVRWQDNNTQNPRTVTVTANATYTATFEAVAPTQYTVTVNSNNSAWGSVSGGGTYNSGATATLTATPNSGYRFVRWQDNNTQNPRTVTVTANATYTATFEAIPPTQYTITVNSNNSAWGSVSGGGTYNSGATATLIATPNSGYRFVRWQDNNTQNPRTVTVTANATYTATFEAIPPTQYTITVNSNNNAWGSVSGGGTYNSGATATLTATPNSGYRFVRWQDNNTQNPRTVTVTANATYTATFEAIPPTQYTITVNSNNSAWGSVSGGGTYNSGATATLTATPNSGYRFVRWQDNNTDNPRTITVTADITYTAHFEAETQGIDDVAWNGIDLIMHGTTLIISGVSDERMSITDMMGRTIHSANGSGSMSVELPVAGVYFVRVGDRPARKIMVVR